MGLFLFFFLKRRILNFGEFHTYNGQEGLHAVHVSSLMYDLTIM